MKNQEPESTITYPKGKTALVVVDPLNDLISEGGMAWPMSGTVIQEVRTLTHIEDLLRVAREKGIIVAYAPHHRYREGSYSERKYLSPTHVAQLGPGHMLSQVKWGGDYAERLAPKENEFIASEHACSSGFAGTNLHAYLSEKGISHLIVVGMITNSCIEATVRSAIDLDYHVTLVTDAVAVLDFTPSISSTINTAQVVDPLFFIDGQLCHFSNLLND
jgi:nicotinamidase-related amidase